MAASTNPLADLLRAQLRCGDRSAFARVSAALRAAGSVTKASKALGLGRSSLYSLVQEHPELRGVSEELGTPAEKTVRNRAVSGSVWGKKKKAGSSRNR